MSDTPSWLPPCPAGYWYNPIGSSVYVNKLPKERPTSGGYDCRAQYTRIEGRWYVSQFIEEGSAPDSMDLKWMRKHAVPVDEADPEGQLIAILAKGMLGI